mmetsp:Transcript_49887/g.106633  ORF Transcript_49887/g.106633 Transcript_49887/m.106633 type:complete len:242 (-) Transcript_49887:21-746(-)
MHQQQTAASQPQASRTAPPPPKLKLRPSIPALEVWEASALVESVLGDEAREGHHRKARMLDLRKAEALSSFGVTAEASVQLEVSRQAVSAVHGRSKPSDARNLEDTGSKQKSPHVARGHCCVVCSERRDCANLLGTRRPEAVVHENVTDNSKHANATVLDLCLAQPHHRELRAEPERVKANVTHHRTIERVWLLHKGERHRLLRHHRDAGGTGGRAKHRRRVERQGRRNKVQHGDWVIKGN